VIIPAQIDADRRVNLFCKFPDSVARVVDHGAGVSELLRQRTLHFGLHWSRYQQDECALLRKLHGPEGFPSKRNAEM
jgi:hypothetical protein